MNRAKYQNMFDEKSKKGPYIYDIHEKCPIFASPSHLFLSVRMGLNWARPPPPLDVETQATNHPPTPTPFGILAAYLLYLADVFITYNAHATHN